MDKLKSELGDAAPDFKLRFRCALVTTRHSVGCRC